jgi:serine/threonine protein kinase
MVDDHKRQFGSPSSVLAAIDRIAGEAPRLELKPEFEAGSFPRGRGEIVPRGRGVYRLVDEVARGGMGAVMRAYDADIGRHVALKVLHPELASNSETVQRFVEEAQIGGQLQHPGIVPVYEIGLTNDERPYFSMKLVKGQTLATLLRARKSPEEERRRLLDIFEDLCLTMAYAHSRGVIHRDLNPTNVLVGNFGEVQIVDWGLAKVLPREELGEGSTTIQTLRSGEGQVHHPSSQAGSLMGTIAYLSPEQARGQVDLVDEHADVFSLGGILCEILTGSPPYVGDAETVLMGAASGDVAGAHERLRSSGAEDEIVQLACECLTKDVARRPPDAQALARRVSAFLAGLEQRARNAQIEIDAANARARGAAIMRNVAFGLAAVAAAGAAYFATR